MKPVGYRVVCSKCGRKRYVPGITMVEVLHTAAAFGWGVRRGKVLCGECRTAPKPSK